MQLAITTPVTVTVSTCDVCRYPLTRISQFIQFCPECDYFASRHPSPPDDTLVEIELTDEEVAKIEAVKAEFISHVSDDGKCYLDGVLTDRIDSGSALYCRNCRGYYTSGSHYCPALKIEKRTQEIIY